MASTPPPSPPPPQIADPGSTTSAPTSPSPAAPITTDAPTTSDGPIPLSKNAQKRLLRQQKFAATRTEWKAKKRALEKARKARKRLERPATTTPTPSAGPKTTKNVTIVIDCGFDSYMSEREIVSLSSQVTRCYAVNKAARVRGKLVVSGLDGRLMERYEGALKGQHRSWKGVEFLESGYGGALEDTVYLTADSEDTIAELEEGKRYVVGGIVDRNRYKGLCYEKAVKEGVRTAKLPIGDYVKMASRQVLTTNQVVEIMVLWLETGDWKESFLRVIPKRKGLQEVGEEGVEGVEGVKNGNGDGDGGEEDEDEDEDMDDAERGMEIDDADKKESSVSMEDGETSKPLVEDTPNA